MKTRFLERKRPGRALIQASGTPITNTLGEMYTLLRFQAPEALRERGIREFDAWAAAFAETTTELELQPSGAYKPVTRFVAFINVADLMMMFRSVADLVQKADLRSLVALPRIWRKIDQLEALGWNEQAIADALAQPVRTVRRLKLLAHLHPTMLDVMALGSMPNEDQLRTIAAASREEQAQVWKKHRPKKGQTEIAWYEVARALAKRRVPASAAKFGDDLAKAYGIVWEDDLFAPAGEDSRYTTNVEGFFGAAGMAAEQSARACHGAAGERLRPGSAAEEGGARLWQARHGRRDRPLYR